MIYLILFLSVVVGYVIALFFMGREFRQIPLILAFSGSFLLSVTLFHLLPDVFDSTTSNMGYFIMLGILLQIILDFFSKGAEHGHVHVYGKDRSFPWLLFLSLSAHAILEGFPAADNEVLLTGVVVHKIPIALILTMFFYNAGYSKWTTIVFLLLFAAMSPIGGYIAAQEVVSPGASKVINAIAIGVFLHVSTTILFESSRDHRFNFTKLLTIVLGMGLAYLI